MAKGTGSVRRTDGYNEEVYCLQIVIPLLPKPGLSL